jgi:hypothetical protein
MKMQHGSMRLPTPELQRSLETFGAPLSPRMQSPIGETTIL